MADRNSAPPLIRLEGLTKDYRLGSTVVHALRGVDLEVAAGEMVALMGPSGSGKSTLLHLVGCLDRPTNGRYWLEGVAVEKLTIRQLAFVRNRKLGFIFQTFNLLPRADALDNVALPLLYTGVSAGVRKQRSLLALSAVGLADRARHRPSELSGGQQQRVAIARALVTGPDLLLADEPTGNLDTRTSLEVMAILQQLNAAGITVLLVTHEPDIAAYCPRVLTLQDGQILQDVRSANANRAADALASLPAPQQQGVA